MHRGVIDEFDGQVLQHLGALSARKERAEQPVWKNRQVRSVVQESLEWIGTDGSLSSTM
jgi:hypothetical protein